MRYLLLALGLAGVALLMGCLSYAPSVTINTCASVGDAQTSGSLVGSRLAACTMQSTATRDGANSAGSIGHPVTMDAVDTGRVLGLAAIGAGAGGAVASAPGALLGAGAGAVAGSMMTNDSTTTAGQ